MNKNLKYDDKIREKKTGEIYTFISPLKSVEDYAVCKDEDGKDVFIPFDDIERV